MTVADDFSHECVSISVDWGISGQYVTRLLDQAAVFRLPAGSAHRQRPGVHQSCLHGLGVGPRHPSHPDRAGAAYAKRLHRKLQSQVLVRVLTNNGPTHSNKPEQPSRPGARTTTRLGHTAVVSECLRRSSPSCIASALAMQFNPAQRTPRSILRPRTSSL